MLECKCECGNDLFIEHASKVVKLNSGEDKIDAEVIDYKILPPLTEYMCMKCARKYEIKDGKLVERIYTNGDEDEMESFDIDKLEGLDWNDD